MEGNKKEETSTSLLKLQCLRMTSKNTAKDLYNGCGMTPTVHSFPNERKLYTETRIEQGTFKLLVNHIKGEELGKGSHNYTVLYTAWAFHSSVTL